MKRIEKELAKCLLEEDFVRLPNTEPGEVNLPVVFVDPNEGIPSPVDLEGNAETDITVSIQPSGGTPTQPYEGFLDETTYTITYRCKPGKERETKDLSNQIDFYLDDNRAWIMGDLRVEISNRILPLQKIDIGMPEQGSIYFTEYVFLVRKEHLQEDETP